MLPLFSIMTLWVGLVSLLLSKGYSSHGGIIVGRKKHKPYYWTVQWCRKVEQSGLPIAGWSAVLSLLSQLSHLSCEDRVAEVRCDTVSIVRLMQLHPTGGQPSQWTFLHHNTALMLPGSSLQLEQASVKRNSSFLYTVALEIRKQSRTTISQDVQNLFPVQLAYAKFLSRIKGNFGGSAVSMILALY